MIYPGTVRKHSLTCICRRGPDNSSPTFCDSLLFSSQTKQLSSATHWGTVRLLNIPLNIISVISSSSALCKPNANNTFYYYQEIKSQCAGETRRLAYLHIKCWALKLRKFLISLIKSNVFIVIGVTCGLDTMDAILWASLCHFCVKWSNFLVNHSLAILMIQWHDWTIFETATL
jgi:hypothetical protein